jgi:hypothetical protein
MSADLYAAPQHVGLTHVAQVAPEATLAAPGGRSMHDPANELRRIPLLKLYEKVSNTDEPPRHETNHGSVHERLAARTQPLVIFAHPPVLVDP